MNNKLKIGILTGGGDVQPLNAVIASARDTAIKNGIDFVGFIRGWEGVIKSNFILLNDIAINPHIGGTLLKSSRVNLKSIQNGAKIAEDNLDRLGIEGLIVIGGEDTLSNCAYLTNIPQIMISKTIDNDVGIFSEKEIINYFTLGYPSALRRISSFVSLEDGLGTTAYSHERIIIVESMGMHAGWLAVASSLGNPDFVIIPEFPLNYSKFKEMVLEKYKEQKHAIVVISEGARWEDGSYLSADESEKDSFGHPRFKGSAEVLAKHLKVDLKEYFDTRNVNSVNPSYLYRSGRPCELDFKMATALGCRSVELLTDNTKGVIFLTISRKHENFKVKPYDLQELGGVDKLHRFVDDNLYDNNEYSITPAGRNYLSSIMNSI